MPRKPNPEIVREIDYRDNLENIIDDIDDIMSETVHKVSPPEMKRSTYMDFEKIKEEADQRAGEIVDSIIEFYLDARMYEGPEAHRFLKNKMEMDKMTVSNLIFQMKTAEHAITKLLEEIDSGNMHPRQFEVLASLQKSKMDIVKHLSFVSIQLENNYKIIRQEYDNLYQDKSDKTNDLEHHNSGGLGTKNMLLEMQNRLVEKTLSVETEN